MNGVELAGQLRRHALQAVQAEPVGVEELTKRRRFKIGGGNRKDFGENGEDAIEKWEELLSKRANRGGGG